MATLPELFLGPFFPIFREDTPDEPDLSGVPRDFYPQSQYTTLSDDDRWLGFCADSSYGNGDGRVTGDELVAYSEFHPKLDSTQLNPTKLNPTQLNPTKLAELIRKFDPDYLLERPILDGVELLLSQFKPPPGRARDPEEDVKTLVGNHGDLDQQSITNKVDTRFQNEFSNDTQTRDLVALYLLRHAVRRSDPDLFAAADILAKDSENSELRRLFDQAAKIPSLAPVDEREPLQPLEQKTDWVVIGEPRRESKPVF